MQTTTVFGTWQISKPLGTGTYGKTYEITNFTGETGIYKLIKIPVELIKNPDEFPVKTHKDRAKEIRNDFLGSVAYINLNDEWKHFVKYEDCSVVPSDDFTTLSVSVRMEKLLSLSAVLERQSLSQDEVLRLAVNVCRCLEKCREMDYVYTNLKPNNIFITSTGCKLGDFGTFGLYEPKKINVAMRKSQDYMAPEMIKFGEINPTSDTYALGLIMYSLLNNNKLPFIPRYEDQVGINDANLAIEKRCANYVFTDPDDASEEVKKIIFKACDSSVSNRYESPTEMKNDLLAALGEQREENPFEKSVEIPLDNSDSSDDAPNIMENITTYEYDNGKKKDKKLDRKKMILLIAIGVVFLVLVAVIAAIIMRDIPENASIMPAYEHISAYFIKIYNG